MRRRDTLLLLLATARAPGREAAALTDSYGDGWPDFLRLRDRADQEAFRRWSVWLAEALYVSQPALPPDVNDCAALLRFCCREALRRHDAAWAREWGLPALPPLPDVRQFNFPAPRLRDRIFRVRAGPFQPADLDSGAFRAFADAEHLMRRNAHLLGRDVSGALPGDLLFYHQLAGRLPFHAMLWTGEAAVYHTGPTGNSKGVMRRLLLSELDSHPEPRWRPRRGNPNFLGVYRWNLLRDPT
jgi:uncharacterized protein